MAPICGGSLVAPILFTSRWTFSRPGLCAVGIEGCYPWNVSLDRLLDELHQEHHVICHMKSLAREYLWWPGLDADIAQRVSGCHVCASVSKLPPKAPLHLWKWPTKPWERIHIDFFEKDKSTFLIVIDAYSKWLEVIPMTSVTSLKTIEVLCSLFAHFGLPKEVVSDNGPQLASEEFAQFLKQWCQVHPRTTISPSVEWSCRVLSADNQRGLG